MLTKLHNHFRDVFNAVQVQLPPDTATGPPFHVREECCEYRRCALDIHRQVGGEPCDVVGFGSNEADQLGFGAYLEDDNAERPPQRIPPFFQNVRSISAGGLHSVCVTNEGRAYSWGNSDDGTLGREFTEVDMDDNQGAINQNNIHNGTGTPSEITGFVATDEKGNKLVEDGTITNVVAGTGHILFKSLSGRVYMCGVYKDMDSGKFRDGPDIVGFNERPVHVDSMPLRCVHFSTTESANVALLEDNTAVTWGESLPYLPYCTFVLLLRLFAFCLVVYFRPFQISLLRSNEKKYAGFGNSGELARTAGMNAPRDQEGKYIITKTFMFDDQGKPKADLIKEHFLTPKPVMYAHGPDLKRTVIAVEMGGYHLLVAARDPGQFQAKLWTSGLNNYGQLGLGDVGGATNRHELTLVKSLERENIAKVAAGQFFSLALSHDGERLYAFGRADYGSLGVGYRSTGAFEASPQLVRFPERYIGNSGRVCLLEIAAGERHSLATDDENRVYSWGFNETGCTGHPARDDNDYFVPKKLDLVPHLSNNGEVVRVDTHGISGGGQHSLLLVKRYSST